jgi:hypothetical protein
MLGQTLRLEELCQLKNSNISSGNELVTFQLEAALSLIGM